ncbi:hypothetical protein NJL88_33985 [Streptomyces sp. DK15]|uniref:hypothetical protein n=1 Tax=Streptomyces sp. DK15 TaxID=2957499 RepID=UPI0029A8CD27|nr:hypothetical protein [Streptomyces sp. DK15]MDX2394988.1 hypothetical protein [Streptomyces sp. DK15]
MRRPPGMWHLPVEAPAAPRIDMDDPEAKMVEQNDGGQIISRTTYATAWKTARPKASTPLARSMGRRGRTEQGGRQVAPPTARSNRSTSMTAPADYVLGNSGTLIQDVT